MNEIGENMYDHYRENPFSVLESPPMEFADATSNGSAADAVEHRDAAGTDEASLELDGPSVARVGSEALVRIGAAPVRRGENLEIVVAETTGERIAAVREHFSTEVPVTIVSGGTLDRLLDAARKPAAEDELGNTFERVLGLFDEEAGRFQLLRQKIQELGTHMADREHRLHQLEAEVDGLRTEREQDRRTIDQLRNDLSARDGRLAQAAAKAEELSTIIRGSSTL